MQRAKSFLFVCLGILALAIAYHSGATTSDLRRPRGIRSSHTREDTRLQVTAMTTTLPTEGSVGSTGATPSAAERLRFSASRGAV